MVLREGMLVTAIGVAIGLLGAVALSRVLASLVFGVSALDPRVMAGAAVFMVIVAASRRICRRIGQRLSSRARCSSRVPIANRHPDLRERKRPETADLGGSI